MAVVRRPPVRLRSYLLAFGIIALFLILAHGPLLDLPFYWDEAGQFIPASLDILRTGAWIPVSTVPNVHPPGVMAYLAGVWSIFGYSIAATRIAMLLVAASGALLTFLLAIELSRGAPGTPAFAALAMLCLSPLFFAQSILAQLDMPAMCLSLLALLLFLQNRFRASAAACVALVLVKETGIVAPLVFGAWLLWEGRTARERARAAWFLMALPGLLIWLLALHNGTGQWFGNAAFTAYNLNEPLQPLRFAVALLRRLYYLFVSTGHLIGTVALLWALRRMPLLRDRPWRIAGSFVIVHVIAVSALGGAVLERYLLPALPIVYIAFAVALRALFPRTRTLTLGAMVLCLIGANFVNPFYPFPFENNLAFASFVQLEQDAAADLEGSGQRVIAAPFPLTDALRNPDLGFVKAPRRVVEIVDFSRGEVEKLKEKSPDILVYYRRNWDPLHLTEYPLVSHFLAKQYGYRAEMSPEEIGEALSMHITSRWDRRGLSMELLERFPAAR